MSKTKNLNRRRYQPVSEFDEATLASKREYWRTRKREQRARLSLTAKKSSKSPKTGIHKPAFTGSTQTTQHVSGMPCSQFSSTLLSSAGSYQTTVTQNLTNSCRLTPEIKSESEISQKEASKPCEKTTCNTILQQFPESSTDSKKCVVVQNEGVKGLTTEESNLAAPMVNLNGAPFTKCFPVPTPCIKVQTDITETRQAQNRLPAFNGDLSNISLKSSVSRFTPQCSQQKNTQIRNCLPPRAPAFVVSKVNKDQHVTGGRGANPSRNACAYVPERSTAQGRNADPRMTEEEKTAKRRENWRIKKREQRAKRAEKLKKANDKTQRFEKRQQDMGKLSCVVPAHSLSSGNTMALRKAKQPNSVKSADVILSNGKPVHFTVKLDGNVLPLPIKQSAPKHHLSTDVAQGSVARNFSSVNCTNHLQNSKPHQLPVYSGVSLRASTVTRAPNQPKINQQNLVQTLRRQSLPHRFPQWYDRVETAEERLAKQREYWRIRKRLQRARLSVEMKARLREQDALKRCGHPQRNLGQMRKIQTGLQRMPQANKITLTSASKTTRGFIKDNSTASIPILQASAEIFPKATSCISRAVQSSPPTSSSTSQKMVCVRTNSAKHTFSNCLNSSVNIPERSTGLTVAPVLGPNLANSTPNADVLKGMTQAGKGLESNQEDRTACKRVLRSSDSSCVTPSLDVVPHDAIKQERSYPSVEYVDSFVEQSNCMDIKDVKPPSPPPETKIEKEAPSNCDNQATTLLAVASMKKLLEESLSSVVDSSTGQDAFLPCKTEDKLSPQETEASTKPDLTTHEAAECNFSGYTNPSIEVKQSPTLCHSPLQAPGFSAEDAVLSCQASSLQFPLTVTTESPCLSQGPEHRTHALSVAVGVKPIYRGLPGHRGKRSGPHQRGPPQAHRGQQPNERSELQKKREYWRVMKRRQRARKAKERERCKYAVQHKQLSQPIQRKYMSSQVHHPPAAKPASHANLNNHAVLTDVTLRPTRIVLSPTASNQLSNQPSSNGGRTKFSEASQMKKWQLQASAPTSVSRQETVTSTQMNHVKPSSPQTQIRRPFMGGLKNNQRHLKAAANQGLDPEEILRKRRMHWRIKKQEQRARKAAREKELRNQTNLSHLVLDDSNVTELVQSHCSIPPQKPDYLPKQCEMTSFKEEAEVCFLPADDCSDEPLSEAKLRSIYLMDYDAVNQLLVCMVCGEQQYCLSVEGVKAHIEEAHPDTLSLEELERQNILQTWDEQVAVRERFFTNQLWQQNDSLKGEEGSMMRTAEVEVILDADDIKQTKT